MIEEDPITGKKIVGLAVIDGEPVGVDFGASIGAAGVERSFSFCGTSWVDPNISLEDA